MLLRRSPAHLRQCPLRVAQPRLQFALRRRQRRMFLVRRQPRVRQRVLGRGKQPREVFLFHRQPVGLVPRRLVEFVQRSLMLGQPPLQTCLQRLETPVILHSLPLRLRQCLTQCRLLRFQAFLPMPGLQMQIRMRLLRMPQPLFQAGLLRSQRAVFFRSGSLKFRERLFTGGDPLFELGLCLIERRHFLGRGTSRFHEALHALRKLRLQFVLRGGKCCMLLGGKPVRLRKQVLRLRQTQPDARLLRGDSTLCLLRSTARFLQRLRDGLQAPVQLAVLRGKRRVLSGGEALRLSRGIGKFRQPALEFRLRRIGGMPLLFERTIRLLEAHLQLLL